MNAKITKTAILALTIAVGASFFSMPVSAELPPDVERKAERYKDKLVDWARNPVFVAAVRDANSGNALAGMTNAKWDGLSDTDPVVVAFQTSPAGRMLGELESDKNMSKLYLRDARGNLVAGSNKPILYNNANRKPVSEAMKGAPFVAKEIKPDPTTQVKAVQVSVPVLDNGRTIGVLQTSVVAD